jgi:hypothetical protein
VASLFQKLAGNRRVITYDEFLNGMQWLNKVSCAISLRVSGDVLASVLI